MFTLLASSKNSIISTPTADIGSHDKTSLKITVNGKNIILKLNYYLIPFPLVLKMIKQYFFFSKAIQLPCTYFIIHHMLFVS